MTLVNPRLIILRGKRWVSCRQLLDEPQAVTEATQELLDLADFQLTCLPKWLGAAPSFRLSTEQDERSAGIWVKLFGSFYTDEPPPEPQGDIVSNAGAELIEL